MMEIFSRADNRALGTLGISMATELGILGAFGQHPDNPLETQPIKDYEAIWVNLDTLARNAHNALSKEDKVTVLVEDLVNYVQQDMELITNYVTHHSNLTVVPYINHYKKMEKRFPRAIFRTVKTQLQKDTYQLMSKTKEVILKDFEGIKEVDFTLPGVGTKAVIMTHQPVDLLSYPKFKDPGLLESHTGTIKTRKDWHTKFSGDMDLSRIPFNQATLQIFGDGSNFFAVMPIKLRKYVLDLAERKDWTWMTTKDKILQNSKYERDPVFEQLIKDLFKDIL